jgi:hypothetical protein
MTEWILVATILVIGLIPGLIAVRQGVLSELVEFANAVMGLDQSYGYTGTQLVCTACDTRGVEGRDVVGENVGWDHNRGQRQLVVRPDDKGVQSGVPAGKWDNQGWQNRMPLAWTAGSAVDNRPLLNANNVKGGTQSGTVCNGQKFRLGSVPATPNSITAGPCN